MILAMAPAFSRWWDRPYGRWALTALGRPSQCVTYSISFAAGGCSVRILDALEPPVHRVVPVGESVWQGLETRPFENVAAILAESKAWGVNDCICRKQQALIGKPCGHPLDVCMAFSDAPGAFDGAKDMRALTQAEALATLATLSKKYPQSRTLEQARALEMDVRRSAGQPVRPENVQDEDLKLYALQALGNQDPDQAVPMLEKIIRGDSSSRLKERAMFVLAQMADPFGQPAPEPSAKVATSFDNRGVPKEKGQFDPRDHLIIYGCSEIFIK